MQQSPSKKSTFGFRLCFPNRLKFQFAECALELNTIGTFGCVFPIQRQRMLSSVFSISWIWLTSSQRVTYSLISCAVLNGMACDIQRLSSKAFCTVRFFLFDFLNNVGAIAFGVRPPTQDDVQNLANLPSPTVTTVEAANNFLSRPSTGRSSLFQALSQCFH